MLDQEQRAGDAAPEAGVPRLTLGEYLAEAGKALRTNLPKAWVEAVVLDAKNCRSGLSLELVEPMADERHDGRLRCQLWARTKAELEADIGLPLDITTLKGTHLRLLLKTNFHRRWHLEGEVLDVDPAIVESLVAKRIEHIRQTLQAENLYGAQRQLGTPADVTTVAVIHPDRSAGWADVREELERLEKRGILAVRSYSVPFEGAGSASGIAEVLHAIGSKDLPDLVLIVRGGGAAAGLASLANLALARAVCRCPVPIITGLGHASDRTILDDLAWKAADTPSKALGVVKAILQRRCATAVDDHRTIVQAMDRLVGGTLRPLLAGSRDALCEAAERMTASQEARLREHAHEVERHVITFRGSIDLTQADLDQVAASLIDTAPRVPRGASAGLTSLFAGIASTAIARLPGRQALPAEAYRSASLATAFVNRQAANLRTALTNLENAMRRHLADEAARLSATATAAQALDVTATLARGFVLPLDCKHRIIRSAVGAQAKSRRPIEISFRTSSQASTSAAGRPMAECCLGKSPTTSSLSWRATIRDASVGSWTSPSASRPPADAVN